jgi:hypothetical protein
VPNWQPGDAIALNLDRTLRVVEVRHDDPDANPVRVVEEGMNEGDVSIGIRFARLIDGIETVRLPCPLVLT